jgi:hypothetical protein
MRIQAPKLRRVSESGDKRWAYRILERIERGESVAPIAERMAREVVAADKRNDEREEEQHDPCRNRWKICCRVRAEFAGRTVDAAVFQSVPGALAGDVRRDGREPGAEDRQRPKARTAALKQASCRAKAHRLARLKHQKQAEEVTGLIALRAVVLGAQWTR